MKEIRIISSKHELSSSELCSRSQANETTPILRELTPAHVLFSVSLMLLPSNCTPSTIIPTTSTTGSSSAEVRELDSDIKMVGIY